MGQTSSLLVKSTLRNENDRIKYATSSMQGLCSYMEDASAAVLDLDLTGSTSFFGVYDGHGGANVALYCANRFHTELLHDEDYQNNLDDAVGHVFFRMDEQLREDDEWRALAKPRRRFSFNLLNCLKAPACVKGSIGVIWNMEAALLHYGTLWRYAFELEVVYILLLYPIFELEVGVVVMLSAWFMSWRSNAPKFSLVIVPWMLSLIIFPESREPLTLKEAQPLWLSLEETGSLLEMLVILAAYSQGMVRQWIYPPITNQTFRMKVGEFKMLEGE
ncbi:uncharacterized protein LOC124653673 [Lolium rigidum]|nr:uncharacterized protein LOC124653673 [Lolium rigidum]